MTDDVSSQQSSNANRQSHRTPGRFSGIRTRLTLLLLLTTLGPFTLVAIISYGSTKGSLQNEIRNHLESLANVQASRLTQVIVQQESHIDLFANSTSLRRLLKEFAVTGDFALRSEIQDIVNRSVAADEKLLDAALLSPDGTVSFQSGDGIKISFASMLASEISGGEYQVSRFDRDPQGRLLAYLIGPIRWREEIVATAVMHIEIPDFDSVALDYTGMGRTGETVIAHKFPDGGRFIVPLRFDPNGSMRQVGSKRLPVHDALDGIVRFDEGSGDYRGVPVVSVTALVPEAGLGIVVKMDLDEAYAPVAKAARTYLSLGGMFVLVVVVGSSWAATSIVRPIRELTEVSSTIADGGFGLRVDETGSDEIGILARTFNRMSSELTKAIGRLSSVVEHSPTGILIVDAQGRIELANPAIAKMFGWSIEELLGRQVDILVPDRYKARHSRLIQTYVRNPTNRPMSANARLEGHRKDGSLLPLEIGLSPMRKDDGSLQILAIVSDVSERRAAEDRITSMNEDLRANNRKLMQADRMKSQFLANMSHELRTPLNGIIGFAEFLIDGKPGPLNQKQHNFMSTIHKSAVHLLQLVNDVLDLAKVEAGRFELHVEDIDPTAVIEEACAVVGGTARERSISIAVSHGREAPARVHLDPARFKQIVYNLLSNAVKYSHDNSKVGVVLSANDESTFSVMVWDKGVGVAPVDQARLFKEFEQVDNSVTRKHDGAGLGLTLTRKLVEMMSGRIKLNSAKDKGTTVIVTLPIRLKPVATQTT